MVVQVPLDVVRGAFPHVDPVRGTGVPGLVAERSSADDLAGQALTEGLVAAWGDASAQPRQLAVCNAASLGWGSDQRPGEPESRQ